MKLASLAAIGIIGALGFAASSAQRPSPWEQPTAALAGKIADLLGPGSAHLTVRNLSSIPSADLPAIEKLLLDDLRARGVTAAGSDSANAVRVTLSENAKERLWVAEIIEGTDTKVAMIDAGPATQPQPQVAGALMLRRVPVFTAQKPVLALLRTPNGLVVLEPDAITIYGQSATGWRKLQSFRLPLVQLSRDPRGILRASAKGPDFEAWLPGQYCSADLAGGSAGGVWTVDCRKSDDPWLISAGSDSPPSAAAGTVAPALPPQLPYAQPNPLAAVPPPTPMLRAFYNAARNYFTGVIIPNPIVSVPPFYSAVFVPRPAGGDALLIGGIDGKLQLLQNGSLTPVGGGRDWGSDFAALYSGCGTGTQVVAAGSGQASSDSLRAYDVPALEAIPASEPLAMNGTVTALWTAPDGDGVMAVVRTAANRYEVDRVSASCN